MKFRLNMFLGNLLLYIKVCVFYVCDTATSRGQYLASSEA